jgi:hypothetical protein
MEMQTLRRPTSGKLVCFANENIFWGHMKWLTLLESIIAEKWKCRLLDVRHLVS